MIRSRNYYPKFQEIRDEMDLRPLRYKQVKGRNMFRLDDWKYRHYEARYRAMINQKREPFIFAGVLYFNRRDK